MEDYTVIKDSNGIIQSITRNKDPIASIPVCEGNSDYAQYLDDVANGVSVDEVVMPEPTPQPDRLADIEAALLDLAEAIL